MDGSDLCSNAYSCWFSPFLFLYGWPTDCISRSGTYASRDLSWRELEKVPRESSEETPRRHARARDSLTSSAYSSPTRLGGLGLAFTLRYQLPATVPTRQPNMVAPAIQNMILSLGAMQVRDSLCPTREALARPSSANPIAPGPGRAQDRL